MGALKQDVYPLSAMQEALLFQVLYSPDSGVNVVQSVYEIVGDVRVDAFTRVVNRVMARHSSLRTCFLWKGLKNPVQVVEPVCDVDVESYDWRGVAPAEQRQALATWLRADRGREFELSRAPLMRYALMQTADRRWTFVWSWHHMLLDGWSVRTVMREIVRLYNAEAAGRAEDLPPVRPFRDYIAWLQRLDLGAAEQYWRRALKDITVRPGTTPYKYRATPIDDEEGGRFEDTAVLSEELNARLGAAARQFHVTVNTVIQGAWAIVLSRQYGQEDVVFGELVNGRPPELAGAEEMVGLFLTGIPVRVRVDRRAHLARWLQELQANQAEARRYQYSPVSKLREWSNLPPTVPLFGAVMVFQNASLYHFDELDGAQSTDLKVISGEVFGRVDTNQTALIVEPGTRTDQGWKREMLFRVVSDGTLFETGTERIVLRHLRNLLERMASGEDARLGDLEVMTEVERLQIMRQSVRPEELTPATAGLHQLFEAQAERTPEDIAAEDRRSTITYRELNRRANALAAHLQTMGAGPEVRIGIFMARSIDVLVALLATLKSGAAYVPLDPSYPSERQAFMIEDSGAVCIVTESRMAGKLPATELPLVRIDALKLDVDPDSGRAAPAPSPVACDASHLAYVIYTSGSTGTPKGVGITHGNAVAMVQATRDEFDLAALRRMVASTSICFDLSVFELFVPLSVGATAVILDDALEVTTLDPRSVTFLNTVPSLMEELVANGWTGHGMPVVALAGEALHRKLVTDLYETCGVERVYNLYGPTEDTTYSTSTLVERLDDDEPSIGRALKGGQAYVLDPDLHVTPALTGGELYLGGVGLARGYLGRPALTAERFVPNPFGAPGERLYRTGDRARWRGNGEIEFNGRMDHQVKLRGLRIELGEIESVLLTHADVRQAVVLDRVGEAGHLQLLAYIVGKDGKRIDTEALRSHLARQVPGYSVPARFIAVDAIPLTPNGKIDRRALLALDQSRWERHHEYVGPSDVLELRLVHIWESVLNVRPIGVTDRFIDLGGHSFLAIRLVAQIQKQFGDVLDLRTIVDLDTIQQVARVLHGKIPAPAYSPLVAMQPKGSEPPLFAVHGIGGQVLELYPLIRRLGDEIPIYGLQADSHVDGAGGDGEDLPSIESTAAAYLAAIRTVQPHGPYRLAGYSFGGIVAFEIARQAMRAGETVSSVVLIDSIQPLLFQQFPEDAEDDEGGQQLGFMAELFRGQARVAGKPFSLDIDELAPLSSEARYQRLFEILRDAGLMGAEVPPQIGLAYLRRTIAHVKARHRAVRRYRPDRLDVRVISLKCADNEELLAKIARYGVDTDERRFGWTALSTHPIEEWVVPGSHSSMLQEPHVQELAARVREAVSDREVVR